MTSKSEKELIHEANKKAVERMLASRPVLVDVKPAIEAIPSMTERTILHAGPPVELERMVGSFKNGILGAIQYENWAENPQEAEQLIRNGEVIISPCHNHNAIGTMAGITSPSMPVFVVEDKTHGHFTYANIREETVKALRYGVYDENIKRKLEWNQRVLGPVIKAGLKECGGVDLINLIARSLHMGDDGHNQNRAANALFALEISSHLMKTGFTLDELQQVMSWMHTDDRFISTAEMAACKAICLSAHGIENCSIVTVMCRNGTDTGVRVSGLGDQWFTAPAPEVDLLFFPGYGPKDATRDMGDSCVTETAGIGALAMAAAPSMVEFVGGTVSDSINYTKEMYEITTTKNTNFTIPYLDFAGCPLGIDIIKVVRTGITPYINTSIGHKEPGFGQVGAGMTRAPMKCFKDALEAFGKAMNL